MKKLFLPLIGTLLLQTSLTNQLLAQNNQPNTDSSITPTLYLPEITLIGRNSRTDIHALPEIVGTSIFAGKKNALIIIDNLNANVVNNNMRQVMAKVPGIHTWESDGSGIQIGIASRGLSPNRSWEFNVRQNGYDISADPFGYPEAYYTPQLQAVQRLQIVRGAGALQYGPQFGGMLNFILRNGSDINKPVELETQNTVGSFGLLNSYTAVGGQLKKFHYYGFFDHRQADGWRENSTYKVQTGFATLNYQVTPKLLIGLEYMRWNMKSQQPGGLTDSLFAVDAQKSFRARNWFGITWNATALSAVFQANQRNRIELKIFGLTGDRNSVGYLKAINIRDSIEAATLAHAARQVDVDQYRNLGAEIRSLSDYRIGKQKQSLSMGVRYFSGNTNRLKNGTGTTGTGYDISITGEYPTDVDLDTRNLAFFAENMFRINDKLIVIPGFRFEHLRTNAEGRLSVNSNGTPNLIGKESRNRQFILFGAGAEYHIGKSTEIYANYTQAYRPMLFSDLTASPSTDVIDPDLKDARGYTMEVGYRGQLSNYLQFDAGVFFLQYNNRIGTITQARTDGSTYSYRTNVANSVSKGVETMVEFNPVKAWMKKSKWGSVSLFISYAYTDARYDKFRIVKKEGNTLVESNLQNNRVENAPEHVFRGGLTYYYKGFSITPQLSYTSRMFSDANNTLTPTANGQTGLIPSYMVLDISATYRLKERYTFRAGINNAGDLRYFTRRSGGYPGPGLLPSDARNFYATVGLKF